MDNKKNKNYIEYGITAFFVLCGAISVIFIFINIDNIFSFLGKVVSAMSGLIVGTVMAYIVYPFYHKVYVFFKKRFYKFKNIKRERVEKLSTFMALLSSILLWILIIGGLLVLLLPELYNAVNLFINNAQGYRESVIEFISNMDFLSGRQAIKTDLIELFNVIINSFDSFINDYILPNTNNIIQSIYNGIKNTVSVFFNMFIGLIIMVYVLYKRDFIVAGAKRVVYAIFSRKAAKKIFEEVNYANKVFTNFFTGKLLDSFIVGILCYVGSAFLLRIQYPYSFLAAIFIGVTNIVPFFGPIVGAIVTIIMMFFVSPIKSIYYAVFVFVLQQFDGNILGPKILGNATGVDNFYVLCSTLLFGGLFGFAGMLLAVPIWAVLSRIVNEIVNIELKKKNLPTEVEQYEE